MILRFVITNKATDGYLSIGLEPEGNVEVLEEGATFELVLVVWKTSPELHMTVSKGGLWITPDWHGAIFQDGNGIMNY